MEGDGPLTVDVMKESKPKPSSTTKKEGKQMNDLMHIVKDMKNEIKKQSKAEKKLVEKVDRIKNKKANGDDLNEDDNNDEDDKSDDLCLLYTSPSPRDKRQSRMPSSA